MNAEDSGSIPIWGNKILHPTTTTTTKAVVPVCLAACSAVILVLTQLSPIRAVLLRAEQVSRVSPWDLGGTQYSSSSTINLFVRGLIWLFYNQQNIFMSVKVLHVDTPTCSTAPI